RPRMSNAWMKLRSEQETETRPIQNLARFERGEVEPRTKRFEHVSRAALRGEGAVAVLDDWKSAGGGDDSGSGRDVDRAREVAAGAAAVGEQAARRGEMPGGRTQRLCCADQFFRGFAFHPKGDERSGHQGLTERSFDDSGEQRSGCF